MGYRRRIVAGKKVITDFDCCRTCHPNQNVPPLFRGSTTIILLFADCQARGGDGWRFSLSRETARNNGVNAYLSSR